MRNYSNGTRFAAPADPARRVYFCARRVYNPPARRGGGAAAHAGARGGARGSSGMVGIWVGFVALVLLLVAVDLFVFNRKAHAVSMREALLTSAVWFVLAMAFNVGVYFAYEHH